MRHSHPDVAEDQVQDQDQRENTTDAESAAVAQGRQPDPAQLCSGRTQAVNLPIGRIEQALRLSDPQETALKALEGASADAAEFLKANCAPEQTLTPTARLGAMERRLDAMLQALDKVQPALESFYGSLDDEQKAQFNRFSARSA